LNIMLNRKGLNESFYDEIVSRDGLYWDFKSPADFPCARTIIAVVFQQPKFSVTFTFSCKNYRVVIPPTYIHTKDEEI